jgi:hypothetical protein
MSTRPPVAFVLGALGCMVFGCSSSDEEKGDPGGGQGGIIFGEGGNNGIGNINGVGNGATTGTGSTSGVTIDACGAGASASCVGNTYAGENLPLDIYVMFDQSCSMSCPSEQTGAGLCCTGGPNPRIDQVRSAVSIFLQDKDSAGIGVGIGFFGYMQAGNTSCEPADYAAPAVRIGALPNNANAVLNALNRVQPTGETPTGAAIRGACTYAHQYQQATPTHTTVVLLVTDGFPEAPVTSRNGTCNPSIPDAVQAATTCKDKNLPVYVLGVGHQLQNLNDIAVAGGTNKAYLVEGANVSQAIVQALNEIRANAQIPCSLQIPPPPSGQNLNYNQVNVAYCSPGKESSIFPYLPEKASCANNDNGWYYDNAADPQQIVLCEKTCATVSRPGSALVTSVGCSQVVGIR